jgi:hypothetical protein
MKRGYIDLCQTIGHWLGFRMNCDEGSYRKNIFSTFLSHEGESGKHIHSTEHRAKLNVTCHVTVASWGLLPDGDKEDTLSKTIFP